MPVSGITSNPHRSFWLSRSQGGSCGTPNYRGGNYRWEVGKIYLFRKTLAVTYGTNTFDCQLYNLLLSRHFIIFAVINGVFL